MNLTLIILSLGLVVAWTLIPIIVVQYRVVVVPTRYREIKDRFLPGGPGEQQEKSAGWYYARLNRTGVDRVNPEEELKAQFWYFHGWNRYARPLFLVIVLSGLVLGLS